MTKVYLYGHKDKRVMLTLHILINAGMVGRGYGRLGCHCHDTNVRSKHLSRPVPLMITPGVDMSEGNRDCRCILLFHLLPSPSVSELFFRLQLEKGCGRKQRKPFVRDMLREQRGSLTYGTPLLP